MFMDKAATDGLRTGAGTETSISIEPSQFDAIATAVPVDEQLSRLMDLLVAVRVHLTTGIMPRAARITGTSDRLYGAVDHVDAAIRVAKTVVSQLQTRT